MSEDWWVSTACWLSILCYDWAMCLWYDIEPFVITTFHRGYDLWWWIWMRKNENIGCKKNTPRHWASCCQQPKCDDIWIKQVALGMVIKESLTWVGRLSSTIPAMLRSNLRWAVLQHAYPLGLWHPTMDVHCQRSRVTCYPLDQNKAHSSAPHLHLLPILPIWYALQVPILVVVTDVHSLVSYNTIHACTLAVWPLAARSIQFTSYSLGLIM